MEIESGPDGRAHDRGFRFVVAQNRAFQLPGIDGFLDEDLSIIFCGTIHKLGELFLIMSLEDTHTRT